MTCALRLNFIRADSVARLLCVAVKPRSFTSSIRSNRPEIACSGLGNKTFAGSSKPHSLLSRLSIERVTHATFPRTAVVIEKLVASGNLREIHKFVIRVHSKRDSSHLLTLSLNATSGSQQPQTPSPTI